MNGIVEMEGFQETFSNLYNNSDNMELNASNIVCSAGNGVGSDSIIVRHVLRMYRFYANYTTEGPQALRQCKSRRD